MAQDEDFGQDVMGLRTLGTNTVVIDVGVALSSPGAPLSAVFSQPASAHAARSLSWATWQIRSRASNDVYLRLPLTRLRRRGGRSRRARAVQRHDLVHTAVDGLAIDAPAPSPAASSWSISRATSVLGAPGSISPRSMAEPGLRANGLPCIGSDRPASAADAGHERVHRPA